jgi:hypothetical protein
LCPPVGTSNNFRSSCLVLSNQRVTSNFIASRRLYLIHRKNGLTNSYILRKMELRTTIMNTNDDNQNQTPTNPQEADDATRHLKHPFIYSEFTYIEGYVMTPETARFLLKYYNVRNRPVEKARIPVIARDMQLGNFRSDSAEFCYEKDTGIILDGQTRKHAIVLANVPVKINVKAGMDPKDAAYIDGNKARTAAQRIMMAEVDGDHSPKAFKVKTKHFQIANMLYQLKNKFKVRKATAYDLNETAKQHNAAISAVVNAIGDKKENKKKNLNVPVGLTRAGNLTPIVIFYEKFPEKAIEFLESVITGAKLEADSPALNLRNVLGKDSSGGGQIQYVDFARTSYAIKMFLDNNQAFKQFSIYRRVGTKKILKRINYLSWIDSGEDEGEE